MVEREGVAVVAGEFPVFLIAELRRIKVASEAENVVFNVVVVHRVSTEIEVGFVRAVVAIFLSIVHPVCWNLLAVVTIEVVLLVGVVALAAAEPALEDLGKGVFKFSLKVLCHGFAEGFTGVAQHVAHHDEHDRVAGRAGFTSHNVDGRPVAKINLKRPVRLHVELNGAHVDIALVVALAGEFVADADIEFPGIEAELFHGQAREVNVVFGRADVSSVDHAAHVVDLMFVA